jgi:hypothetical protein
VPPEIVSVAVEGPTDTEIVARVFGWLGIQLGTVYGERGKSYLDGKLGAWNAAAKFAPWLVVRDLDHDADCAPTLVSKLLPAPSAFMRFRVPVRSIDAWLLADRERLASSLFIPVTAVPSDPDSLSDPKQEIVNLARRSKRREVRDDLVPHPGMTAKVGPAFAARMIEFARKHWRPSVAVRRSESLSRTVDALAQWRR